MDKNKYYITTPIYYVNSEPHIGSAYTTIAADVLARWHRSLGKKVFLLTGTDEHGQKIQEIAESLGLEPKKFVDKMANKFKEVFKRLNISNSNFIRTTNEEHEKEVRRILQELYDKKLIYKGDYESYYCVGCEQYKTKSELTDGKCPLHKTKPQIIKEESYMFKLSNFQSELLKLIKNDEYQILPKKRKNEVLSFIEEGLQDISISRLKSKVNWGIELPFDKEHTCYVWVDAFWNYLTGLKTKENLKRFWPPDLQLMANDILRVHATIWPALLIALDYKPPKTLFIHGYFTVNGQKMSKSLGNVINPAQIIEKYGTDTLRYYLLRKIPFGQDGDFSEDDLKEAHNNELANDLGNLISRSLAMTEKYFNGKVPKGKNELKFDIKHIEKLLDNLELTQALTEIWKLVKELNKYVNDKKPWEAENKEEIIYTILDNIRIISILLSPFIPETIEKINCQLGIKTGKFKDTKANVLKPGTKTIKGEILFKKHE